MCGKINLLDSECGELLTPKQSAEFINDYLINLLVNIEQINLILVRLKGVECFHCNFEFSQTSISVSVTQL